MKKSITLKVLVSFSFMIFFLPFLQTCSDKDLDSFPMRKAEVVDANETIEALKNNDIGNTKEYKPSQTEILKENRARKENLIQSKKENTVNFYEFINKYFGGTKFKEYDVTILGDKTFYPFFGFVLIFLNSILLLILTFINKYKLIYRLGILNLMLLIFSTSGLILLEIIEEINQIKIGYYLFALNSIFIILIAKKDLKMERNYS